MNKRLSSFLCAVLFSSLFGGNYSSVCAQVQTDAASTDSVPHEPTWTEKFQQRLTPLIQEAERAPYYSGICIYDLTADSLLFGYNQQKVMRPASTQKVLTAVTALSVLGKNHKYTTRAYYDGTITAVNAGETTITAKADGYKDATINVVVLSKSTVLKDKNGNTMYVKDGDNYREAT